MGGSKHPGIRRLSSGSWQVLFRAGGRQRARSFPTLRDAKAFQAATKADLQRGAWIDPAGAEIRLAEWAELWLELRRVRPTTAAATVSRLETHVLPTFGQIPLGAITHMADQAWVRDMEKAGLARETVQACHRVLAKLLRDAVRERLITWNPASDVSFDPTAKQGRRARALTTGEASRLLEALAAGRLQVGVGEAADGRNPDGTVAVPVISPVTSPKVTAQRDAVKLGDRAENVAAHASQPALPQPRSQSPHDATPYTLVLVLLGTGLRIGEAAGLRRGRVHLLRRPPVLEVAEAVQEVEGRLIWGPPKSKASLRTVPLPAVVAQALAAYLPTGGDPTDPVFAGPRGGLLSRTRFNARVWKPALERAGLKDVHVHDCRHTYISVLENAGIPRVVVAALAGHASGGGITGRYAHAMDRTVMDAVGVMDEWLRGVLGGDVGFGVGG
jgi:integrase